MEIRFINEPIEVEFEEPPLLLKKPGCPDRILWRDETHQIVAMEEEWHDYRRRGRMGQNMQPAHLRRAQQRGSWGVGRDYYRVRTADGRRFEIYYDRAPKDSDDRTGSWILNREILEEK